MSGRVSGVCYVKVDGEELSLQGSLSIHIMPVNRAAVTASGRVVGYSEDPIVPQIDGTFVVDENFPMAKLVSGTAMTILAELANGMKYVLSDAFLSGDPTFDANGGTVQMTFQGTRGDWS